MNLFNYFYKSIFLFIFIIYTFQNPIEFQIITSCKSSNSFSYYFNSSRLACLPCYQNETYQKPSSDGLSCQCTSWTKLVVNFGGEIECEICSPGFIQGFSPWECVECDNCTSFLPNSNQILIERELNGSYNLGSPTQIVSSCAAFTSPDDSRSRCYRCDQILSVSNSSDCFCNYEANGMCFRELSDYPINSLNNLFRVTFSDISINSFYFSITAQAAVGMCRQGYWNTSACQNLANLCVLTLYSTATDSTCSNFLSISSPSTTEWGWTSFLPWIFYNNLKPPSEIIGPAVTIPSKYAFGQNKLNLKLGAYSPNGIFMNYYGVENGRLQLCKNSNAFLNSAYTFGNYYIQNCEIEGKLLWDEELYKLIFYDLWLEYADQKDNTNKLYALPLQIDFKGYYRRFFLVDNLSGKESSLSNPATFIRYAKKISLDIQLSDSSYGVIYPPLLNILYDSISYADAFLSNKSVQISFEVNYSMRSVVNITSTITIITCVLSGVAILLSLFKTWSWSNRSGLKSIDLMTLLKFVLFACDNISTVLFLMLAFGCSIWWIIFKFQGETVIVTTKNFIDEYVIFISLAFSFKFVHIIHAMYMQINADVFFVDWDRSGIKSESSPQKLDSNVKPLPSAQRVYECARRWAELQTSRSTGSPTFRIFFSAFLLQTCGFGNLATLDSLMDFDLLDDDQYHAPTSTMFRFAIIVIIYFSIALFQWLFYKIFYERFIEETLLEFVDYLSWSNVSMVAFENRFYGYYIHGRSVHGRGDLSILELKLAILQEQKGICSKRGLEPDTDEQTFVVSFPRKLRFQYDQIMQPTLLYKRNHIQTYEEEIKYMADVHCLLTKLFQNFIDQMQTEMQYIVTRKTLLEEIFSFEIQGPTNIGKLYHDNGHGFEKLLMRGYEMSWVVLEVLFFGLMDFALKDYLFGAALTYFFIQVLLRRIRIELSLSSIAKSTLLDKKFITVHN